MTVKKKEIEPAKNEAVKKSLEDLSLNDLKAEVYDRASMIEQHQMEIQRLQQEIKEVNAHIIAKSKK